MSVDCRVLRGGLLASLLGRRYEYMRRGWSRGKRGERVEGLRDGCCLSSRRATVLLAFA
jgi:hypothetical protein